MKPTGKTTFNYCKVCKKCCHKGGFDAVLMSTYDIKRLQKAGKTVKFFKDGAVSVMALEKGKCKFLGPKGCTLPEKLKPLDCRLFPLHVYPLSKRKYFFMINVDCPYWNKLSKENVKAAKKIALAELKHWTKKEQIGYWT
jgi:Fe-S-cluster containining protein